MKNIILIFLVFVNLTIKAQIIHTLNIDSTHITSNWPAPPLPCPSDTSFTVSNGDTLYFINKLSNTMYNVWINDPHFLGPPTFGTAPTSTNDTIIRIAIINNTTYHILGDNNLYLGSISQLSNVYLLKGTAEFGRKYFINHTVGIDELLGTNILVYPSPAKDVLHIEGVLKEGTKFTVFDLSGKELMRGDITSNRIDIQKLPTGTYLLNISIENHNKVYKFIKL